MTGGQASKKEETKTIFKESHLLKELVHPAIITYYGNQVLDFEHSFISFSSNGF